MRVVSLAYLTLVVLTCALVPAQSPRTQTAEAAQAQRSELPEQQLFTLINRERERAGLPKFQWNKQLAQAARAHAKLLAGYNNLSHQFAGEPALAERLGATGTRFTFSAENIARADSAEEAHAGLMTSPGHRANILSSRYSAVGIGTAEAQGHLFVSEDFAVVLPAYSQAEFADELMQSISKARAAKREFRLAIRDDSGLRAAACSAHGNVHALASAASPNSVMALFTISDPEVLPERLLQLILDQRWRRMDLGVCFGPDAQHGYANFWVAAAFSN